MNFIKVLAFAFLLVPSFSFGATSGAFYIAANSQMTTAGGSQFWYLQCPSGTTVTSIDNVWIDTLSATLTNLDVKLNGSTVFSTTSIPSAGSGRAYNIPLNFNCTGTIATIEFDATNSATFQTRSSQPNSGEEFFITPVDITATTTLSTATHRLIGKITYTPPTSGSTTYVPVNQYVTNLACVNGTPTTTCSFTYSTTTATTTYDYRANFDFITLFLGLLLFALGVYMFRSVAIKYL